MSADFPNRSDWLRVRGTAFRPVRYICGNAEPHNIGSSNTKISNWIAKQAKQRLRRKIKLNLRGKHE